jgi:hypothetical protein
VPRDKCLFSRRREQPGDVGSNRKQDAMTHRLKARDLPRPLTLMLVAIPILFNVIALLPELRCTVPSYNDDVFHYLFIERANQALSEGANPVDHWLPELELGFPQFFYYQHLPHLVVVSLHRLLFERVSLLTLFNLVRYLLMVLFPLTVYLSLRLMEFSAIGAATGAVFSSLLSSSLGFGFDFNSYIYCGYGMYTQLWAMHLIFIATGCLWRALVRGRGFGAAIIASSALVLSDLLYAYMFGIVAVAVWLVSLWDDRSNTSGSALFAARLRRSLARLLLVAVPSALITAYLIVPFVLYIQYLNVAHMQSWLYDSFGAAKVMTALVKGHLFDDHRLPVLTALVLIGVVSALMTRSNAAKLTLMLLAIWLVLFFGRATWGSLVNLLPLSRRVLFHRFSAGVDFGGILAAGLGGEWIWHQFDSLRSRMRIWAPLAIVLIVGIPAFAERWRFYGTDAELMAFTANSLNADRDVREVLDVLRKASPGRVYAGTRRNWGEQMYWGRLHLFDLLPVRQLPTADPWYAFSLNADLFRDLVMPNEATCRLLNIRYLIAPPKVKPPEFFHPILRTDRYTLYEADAGGYFQFGQVARIETLGSSAAMQENNRAWLAGPEPAAGRFSVLLPPAEEVSDPEELSKINGAPESSSPPAGIVEHEAMRADSFDAYVTAAVPEILVVKITYHPNWHVMVDGQEQRTFMVSPSFIGIEVSPGKHVVKGEYRSSRLKNVLLLIGCCTVLTTILLWWRPRALLFEDIGSWI